jgi:hypothetical protein
VEGVWGVWGVSCFEGFGDVDESRNPFCIPRQCLRRLASEAPRWIMVDSGSAQPDVTIFRPLPFSWQASQRCFFPPAWPGITTSCWSLIPCIRSFHRTIPLLTRRDTANQANRDCSVKKLVGAPVVRKHVAGEWKTFSDRSTDANEPGPSQVTSTGPAGKAPQLRGSSHVGTSERSTTSISYSTASLEWAW